MSKYRIKFRDDMREDQIVEAGRLGEEHSSYVFYNGDDDVGRVARDAVLSVVDEKALHKI